MKNDKISVVKAINLTEGEIITLDKTEERKELEAIVSFVSDTYKGTCYGINQEGGGECNVYVCFPNLCACKGSNCTDCYDCTLDFVCDCDGPVGYTGPCNPFKK
ncbi:MAG: hypothetical protein GX447_06790 [Elusimicrobia bacterium]|nr:hypothetical protein [Elusimicrobiota bacterium]